MSQNLFAVQGLQRSGTNLIEQLLVRNFDVRSYVNVIDWKHWLISAPQRYDTPDGTVRLVIVTRNPYAWLHSAYRYMREAPPQDRSLGFVNSWSFSEFLRGPHDRFMSPVDRWGITILSWHASLMEFGMYAIGDKIEHLMGADSQGRFLDHVKARFKWPTKTEEWSTISQHISVDGKVVAENFDADYYLRDRYLQHYTQADLDYVNARLDQVAMERAGYNFIMEVPDGNSPQSNHTSRRP